MLCPLASVHARRFGFTGAQAGGAAAVDHVQLRSPLQPSKHGVPHIAKDVVWQLQQVAGMMRQVLEHCVLAVLRHDCEHSRTHSCSVLAAATWRSSTRQTATLIAEAAAIDGWTVSSLASWGAREGIVREDEELAVAALGW
jgi:hypothetical protein